MDGCQTWQSYKWLFCDPAPETPCSHAILDEETESTNTRRDDMVTVILLAYGSVNQTDVWGDGYLYLVQHEGFFLRIQERAT